jgi:hypothetical protein
LEDQGVGEKVGSEWILGRLAWGVCGLDSTGSGKVLVAGCCECGDEPSGPVVLYIPALSHLPQEVYMEQNSVISAIKCPDCGLQVQLRTPGPEGIVELPANLYLDSLLTVLQQENMCGAGDQNQDKRCSKCQTVGSASTCQHCRQVGLDSKVRSDTNRSENLNPRNFRSDNTLLCKFLRLKR